jgi:tRNA U34 5-methylaminomethyl-2-thiouridine-forming methyltransferase MnmC
MQIIKTSDGSQTIYLPEINEQYHSLNGAITESNFVYIDKGYRFFQGENPIVFEVGFGTGLNCLLTAWQAEKDKRPTRYISIEKFPLENNITDQLNYGRLISDDAQNTFEEIHKCKWNKEVQISEYFSLLKIEGDLLNYNLANIENCNIIYFDAFGPDKQPEMWTPLIFNKIAMLTSTRGVLVTYSAKGEVRRQLSASGFDMNRIPGPPGKIHMLRGIKK